MADEPLAEDEPSLIVADLGDFPDDPEEAMRLLEMLAASQETADLDEADGQWETEEAVDLFAVQPPTAERAISPATFAPMDELADFGLGSGDDLSDFGLGELGGDDDDDMLSWLDAAEADGADAPLEMAELGDLPEDPDEAMAILERLSAAQNVGDIEEEADELDDMLALPNLDDWASFAEGGDVEPEPITAEVEMAPPTAQENRDKELSDVQDLLTEDLTDSLPDWLSMESASGGDFDPLAWLDADFGGGDSGVLGWLAAEEEVTKKGGPKPMLDMDAAVPPKATPATPERRKPAAVPSPEPASKPVSRPVYDPAIFHPARQLLNKGDVDGALHQYEQYLQTGEVVVLIDELEHVVSSGGRNPLLRRLLGDAYMTNGQMQEALDMYIITRDQL
jgi:hypothetical protein